MTVGGARTPTAANRNFLGVLNDAQEVLPPHLTARRPQKPNQHQQVGFVIPEAFLEKVEPPRKNFNRTP